VRRILLTTALMFGTIACTKTVTAPSTDTRGSTTTTPTPTTPTNANVAGSWTCVYASGTTRYAVVLTQTGTAVSGTLTGGGPDYSRWSISGTVQGTMFTMNYVTDLASGQNAPAGAWYHTGTVSADGRSIVGSRVTTAGNTTTFSMTR
jgi:hypothetical protein